MQKLNGGIIYLNLTVCPVGLFSQIPTGYSRYGGVMEFQRYQTDGNYDAGNEWGDFVTY